MQKLLHLDGDASGNTSLCCWPKRHGGREAQRTTLVVVRTGTRDPLARHGIDSRTITGAGTGSFEFEAASGIYTEPQCGSYIFMGAGYGKNRDRDGEPTRAFEPRLFVWATMMSRPAEDRARRDRRARLRRAWQSAVSAATSRLGLGGKIPGHCDPTVNPQPLPHEREG